MLGLALTLTDAPRAADTRAAVRINDTGQLACYAGAGNDPIERIDCEDPEWPGQDALFGRDRIALDGAPPDAEPVPNGFDFTKLSDTGAELPDDAVPGRHPGAWTCTRDNVTGLVWQISEGREIQWHEVRTALMDPRVLRGLCGRHDWRLPELAELLGIADLGREAPVIGADFFPDTQAGPYWTGNGSAPRIVNFNGGFSHLASGHMRARLRRVSGGERFPSPTRLADGSIHDPRTGLVWDGCALGQDDEAACTGSNTLITWQAALQHVQERNAENWRGHANWRLPNIKELASLIDLAQRRPAIDTTIFLNASASAHWSSTSYHAEPRMAWAVFFGEGELYAKEKASRAAVRLVRTGSAAEAGTGPLPASDPASWPRALAPESPPAQLPTVRIHTEGAVPVGRDDYVEASLSIEATAESPAWGGTLVIRGRGNSTWYMDKKPYKLKLDKKTPLLGMPKSKHWALLANHSDKSMLRTRLAMAMGRHLGMAWTPDSRFVRFELNDEYLGIYQLIQTIRIDEDRVNITRMDEDDVEGPAVTGGYLFEIDARLNCDERLQAISSQNIPICIEGPDEDDIVPAQYDYLVDYIDAMEEALYGPDFSHPVRGYQNWLNPDSFIDWYLVNELTRNTDARAYSSIWNYKDRGGRIERGPLWDFDLSSGNGSQRSSAEPLDYWIRGGIWYERLFQDPAFARQARNHWEAIRPDWIDPLPDWIDAQADMLRADIDENFERWPTLRHYTNHNVVVTGSWEGELAYLKDWLRQRIDWLDRNMEPVPADAAPTSGASPDALLRAAPLSGNRGTTVTPGSERAGSTK